MFAQPTIPLIEIDQDWTTELARIRSITRVVSSPHAEPAHELLNDDTKRVKKEAKERATIKSNDEKQTILLAAGFVPMTPWWPCFDTSNAAPFVHENLGLLCVKSTRLLYHLLTANDMFLASTASVASASADDAAVEVEVDGAAAKVSTDRKRQRDEHESFEEAEACVDRQKSVSVRRLLLMWSVFRTRCAEKNRDRDANNDCALFQQLLASDLDCVDPSPLAWARPGNAIVVNRTERDTACVARVVLHRARMLCGLSTNSEAGGVECITERKPQYMLVPPEIFAAVSLLSDAWSSAPLPWNDDITLSDCGIVKPKRTGIVLTRVPPLDASMLAELDEAVAFKAKSCSMAKDLEQQHRAFASVATSLRLGVGGLETEKAKVTPTTEKEKLPKKEQPMHVRTPWNVIETGLTRSQRESIQSSGRCVVTRIQIDKSTHTGTLDFQIGECECDNNDAHIAAFGTYGFLGSDVVEPSHPRSQYKCVLLATPPRRLSDLHPALRQSLGPAAALSRCVLHQVSWLFFAATADDNQDKRKLVVDHVNECKLDDRRANLQQIPHAANVRKSVGVRMARKIQSHSAIASSSASSSSTAIASPVRCEHTASE
jgi:hypothetical protein